MDEWVHRFCTELGNDFFCEVDQDFFRDFSNLVGLDEEVLHFEQALDIILGKNGYTLTAMESSKLCGSNQSRNDHKSLSSLNKTAGKLYSLIHARYILTERGCKKMLYKYLQGDFGHCPRVLCHNANVLPIGTSDRLGEETVKIYCPRCNEIYNPRLLKHSYVDGASFGRTFPHMFFMVFPEYRPPKSTEKYIARLHGFKIHPSAYTLSVNGKNNQVPTYPTRTNVNSRKNAKESLL